MKLDRIEVSDGYYWDVPAVRYHRSPRYNCLTDEKIDVNSLRRFIERADTTAWRVGKQLDMGSQAFVSRLRGA